MDYAIWKACERFKIKPPGVKDEWEKCDIWAQASLIGYDQVRGKEETECIKFI